MENIQNTGAIPMGPSLPPNFEFRETKKPNSEQGSMDMNMSDGGVKEIPVVTEI